MQTWKFLAEKLFFFFPTQWLCYHSYIKCPYKTTLWILVALKFAYIVYGHNKNNDKLILLVVCC